MKEQISLGSILKSRREELGYSLSYVEKNIDISGSYINRLENSKRKTPSLYVVLKLAKFYNLNLTTLIDADYSEDRDLMKSDIRIQNHGNLTNLLLEHDMVKHLSHKQKRTIERLFKDLAVIITLEDFDDVDEDNVWDIVYRIRDEIGVDEMLCQKMGL